MSKQLKKTTNVFIDCEDLKNYREKIALKLEEMDGMEDIKGKIIKHEIISIANNPKIMFYNFHTKLKYEVKILCEIKLYPEIGDIIDKIKIIDNDEIIKASILDKKYRGVIIYINKIPSGKVKIASKKIVDGKILINGIVV